MHEKLNNDDFVLEHFPDELFNELEKKELEETSKKEGIVEGKKEGIIEGKKEIALNMLEKGIDIELIKECTGLSEEEIKD